MVLETKNPSNLRRFATGSPELIIKEAAHVRDARHFASTFVAGVGSGVLASILCAPLDLIRTRMQVWGGVMGQTTPRQAFQEILEREGWKGMFRGLGATLVTVPLFWGVYFPLYDETKHYASTHYSHLHPSAIHCGSAVMTGAVADVICNPLFVIRTRLQTQALHQLAEHTQLQQTGMLQTARQLYTAHGPLVFWRGMSANLMGLSHVAVQFPSYEYLKKYARERRNDGQPETPLELLLASGLAKMSASLLTYPHEVLRSRMMDSRAAIAPTLRGTALTIWTKEGIGGFYTGLPVTMIRVIPNCCITFLSYELLLRWTKDQWQQSREREQQQNR
jgi:solute carrier family 25 folate transporter 32